MDCHDGQQAITPRRSSYGYEVTQWYGLITSVKVPAPIVKKLYAASAEALQAPDVVQRLSADGSDVVGSTPEQFGAYIKAEVRSGRSW
jgi:tripartite-type tricarboxylate transporter receptor subunit TctC